MSKGFVIFLYTPSTRNHLQLYRHTVDLSNVGNTLVFPTIMGVYLLSSQPPTYEGPQYDELIGWDPG